jgi:hypothetical protein
MRTKSCQIVIKGGRAGSQPELMSDDHPSRGQDISVMAKLEDGTLVRLPCLGLVLRVDGRKAVATVNLVVEEVELTSIQVVEDVKLRRTEPVRRMTPEEIEAEDIKRIREIGRAEHEKFVGKVGCTFAKCPFCVGGEQ